MKILYLIKEESGFTDTLKEIIDAQISGGNEVLIVNLYAGNIDYDNLAGNIFEYDRVICF